MQQKSPEEASPSGYYRLEKDQKRSETKSKTNNMVESTNVSKRERRLKPA